MARINIARWQQRIDHYLFHPVTDDRGEVHKVPSIACHCLVTGSILGLSMAFYALTYVLITFKADEWNVCRGARMDSEKAAASTISASLAKLGIPAKDGVGMAPESVRPEQKNRLREQLKELEKSLQTACRVGIFYYTNRSATLTIGTAAGIVALGSLALISKQGWEKSSNVLINIGITSGLVLSSSWTFGQLYGHSQNLETFSTKYVVAYSLLNTVATSLANATAPALPAQATSAPGVALDLNTQAGMAALSQSLDEQLAILHRPTFQIDDSFARNSSQKLNQLLNAQPIAPVEPGATQTPSAAGGGAGLRPGPDR